MIKRSKGLTITGSSLLVASAIVGPSIATPAFATSSSCGTGPTLIEISATVCELTLTTQGNFLPNASMTKIEALLVGAGGATSGNYTYGGNGGEVKIVELNNSGTVDYVVGAGGIAADGVGGNTTVEQNGTLTVAMGGLGGQNMYTPGAPGTVVSTLSSTLFLDDSDCYGGQGTGYGWNMLDTFASCGASYFTDIVPNSGGVADTGSVNLFGQTPNSGAGGSPWISFGDPAALYTVNMQNGADGLIKIRWQHEALPDTGARQAGLGTAMGVVAAATMALAGASLLVAARRRRA